MKPFGERLAEIVREHGPCCVGIDPHLHLLPNEPHPGVHYNEAGRAEHVLWWCLDVLQVLQGIVPMVKPQAAFFEQLGPMGAEVLDQVVEAAHARGFLVILDCKRGDIGSTAKAYVKSTLGRPGLAAPDAVTLNPYLGPESLQPWREYIDEHPGQGAFVLVRTSNPGAKPWQGSTAYGDFATKVSDWINLANEGCDLGNFGAVIGATLERDEVWQWRRQMPHTWFLAPGYGAQGATAQDLAPLFREDAMGAIIPASRAVLFGSSGKPEGKDWKDRLRERAVAFVGDVGCPW